MILFPPPVDPHSPQLQGWVEHTPVTMPPHRVSSSFRCSLAALSLVCLTLLVPGCESFQPRQLSPTIPLLDFPFIMTHDAATGYLDEGLVENWAKTQSSTMNVTTSSSPPPSGLSSPAFTYQLLNGARSFDARPYLDTSSSSSTSSQVSTDGMLPSNKEQLVFHHGSVVVHKPLEEAFQEIFKFASKPENRDELILLYINKCDGGSECWSRTYEVMNKYNITWAHASNGCFPRNMTYGDALKVGRNHVIGGGSIIAIEERCMLENYDPAIECYGKAHVEKPTGNTSSSSANPPSLPSSTSSLSSSASTSSSSPSTSSSSLSSPSSTSTPRMPMSGQDIDYWCYSDQLKKYAFDPFDAYMKKYTNKKKTNLDFIEYSRLNLGDINSTSNPIPATSMRQLEKALTQRYINTRRPLTNSELNHFHTHVSRNDQLGEYSQITLGPVNMIKGDGGQLWMAQAHWQVRLNNHIMAIPFHFPCCT